MRAGRRTFFALPLLLTGAKPLLAADDRWRALRAAIAALEGRGVRTGVAVRRGGSTIFAHRADERFAMCSTFKLPLAAMTLARADGGSPGVPVAAGDIVEPSPFISTRIGGVATLAELARAATTLSDNGATNLLLRAQGGPAEFTRWLRGQGDTVTRLDRWEPEMSDATPGDLRDTTSPAAFALLFERLLAGRGVGPAVGATLRDLMLATHTGDNMLKAGLPAGWREGHKTGAGGHGTRNIVSLIVPPAGPDLWMAVFTGGGPERLAKRDALFPPLARAMAAALA